MSHDCVSGVCCSCGHVGHTDAIVLMRGLTAFACHDTAACFRRVQKLRHLAAAGTETPK